ncbi:SusE domain-containing protein [Gracilimonas amylolytica]|uniref:SusE domain-containing protein n=1 Tax=Gracilimonas amylolytica TaxID=1749045 RepID=UPI000CD92B71|nr:SusE domain-containing protein [Gracilimonas amylolytica]
MKKLNLFIFVLAGLFVFTSCEDSFGPTYSTNVEGPTFTTSPAGQSLVLTEENSEEVAFELEWRKPGVGFRAPAEYTIEMAEAGTDFAAPATLLRTNSNSATVMVGEFNNSLLTAGFPVNVESAIDLRVVADINDNVEVLHSAAVSFAVTPYYVDISYPQIFVPGGYQAASGYGNDWTPGDAPPLTSLQDNDRYEGYVYMANGNNYFKFTAERSWDLNWGTPDNNGNLEEGGIGNDLYLENPGYYKMNVNLNTLTYTLMNTQWGVIGDATPGGWSTDTDMTYDPAEKTWSVDITLSAGEMKFRANDDWALNYGDAEGDGFLDQDGANIPVPASGNYTVILDLSEAPYTYELIQN